ncbi:MAG TPA: hypothetical protein VF167_18845 [Longimicrobiaceae bacterium]
MTFVRTVLGDVPPGELGPCYAHEHIIIEQGYTTEQYPDFLLNSVEHAADELAECYAAGVRAMVDSMPAGCSRSATKLAEVSSRSGVHIVCPTGLHLRKYYPPDHPLLGLDEDALTELFVADIRDGVDANDYEGPEIRRTPHRAGVIKVAGGLNSLNAHEQKAFRAAAAAHRITGAPILTHTEQGTAALEQVKLLSDAGVEARHVVLSHTDRNPDLAYHREILSTGVFVEFDSAFRWKPGQGNPTRDLVVALFAEGLGDQVMLGMDAARRGYWRMYGGAPGLTFLVTEFRSQLLEAGLSPGDFDRIMVKNPSRAFAFRAGD